MSLIIPDKDVLLSISGTHAAWGEAPELVELATAGKLITVANGFDVVYEESELTGMEGTTTIFEIGREAVVLRRIGTVQSEMHFKAGEISTSAYETPYGTLTVEVGTSFLRSDIDENGGELEIRYTIAVEHQVTGENKFLIQVKQLDLGGAER